MRCARALAFNFAFFGWTAILGTIVCRSSRTARGGQCVSAAFGRRASRLLRSSSARPPGRGLTESHTRCIIAMKHQSAWDALILPVVLGDLRPL